MTVLIHQRIDLAPVVNTLSDTIRQAKLRESSGKSRQTERNYRQYTAELRRRHSLE